jgi:hypothetical protein
MQNAPAGSISWCHVFPTSPLLLHVCTVFFPWVVALSVLWAVVCVPSFNKFHLVSTTMFCTECYYFCATNTLHLALIFCHMSCLWRWLRCFTTLIEWIYSLSKHTMFIMPRTLLHKSDCIHRYNLFHEIIISWISGVFNCPSYPLLMLNFFCLFPSDILNRTGLSLTLNFNVCSAHIIIK